MNADIADLIQKLDIDTPTLAVRDRRYRGVQPLRYAADEVNGELKDFSVNISRLAVDAVAERMRIKRLTVTAGSQDVSTRATVLWRKSQLDQLLMPVIVDALALGAVYLIVWPDQHGEPRITPESAMNVAVNRHPITGEVTSAIKRWYDMRATGEVAAEYVMHFTADNVTLYTRKNGENFTAGEPIENRLGVVPVVPVVNVDRIGDRGPGWSVLDDLGRLIDALSKILADMLVASEDVARPRRWATGVDLEEDADDGFTADGAPGEQAPKTPVVSPFEHGNRMFTVESPEAKFGQLPGADLQGYKTAVDLIMQQIMSVAALPAHMVGITTSNPASADATRAAEASLSARAEARISVLGIAIEQALAIMMAIDTGHPVDKITAQIHWASTATKSTAQEADAITKLFSLGLLTRDEARQSMGLDSL